MSLFVVPHAEIVAERKPRLIEASSRFQDFATRQASRFAIKAKGRILFMNLGDVISIHAEGNYVMLRRQLNSYLLRESISTLSEKLELYGFIRIHRSVLVNALLVEEIRPTSTGEYRLSLKGREYTVTRTYKKNLKSLAEFWIGTDLFFRD
jgi:DNA-binding LytR/AlgR family response regulator